MDKFWREDNTGSQPRQPPYLKPLCREGGITGGTEGEREGGKVGGSGWEGWEVAE